MTSLSEEQRAQEVWTARLKRQTKVYDDLLVREFEEPERRVARSTHTLNALLRFAAANVPYYRRLFADMGVDADDPELVKVFSALPILRKLDVRDNEAAFHAERLPGSEKPGHEAKSSGTTGMPLRVRHTLRSQRLFAFLKQREYRWFRLDPGGLLAIIRPPRTLVSKPDGSLLSLGEDYRLSSWPHLREDFTTGHAVAFSILNSPEEQIAWLRRISPDHMLVLAATLEHQALAAGDERPCESLKSVLAISEQLTPDMRAHIEASFRVPIHQNYGLNEIGVVAGRCEAGRYHVHSEHCSVEVVRGDGRPAAPGEAGRLIVTSLANLAMPLLRYDADDMATAVDGPCPCGRTLPSFGNIVGRYARMALMPARSFLMMETVRAAILKMPADRIRNLRQFQVHQYNDGRYELRLLVHALLPDGFSEQVQAAWDREVGSHGAILQIKYVDAIERSASGKYQVFTSDFVPSAG